MRRRRPASISKRSGKRRTFQAALQDGRVRYKPTPDENSSDQACTFDLSVASGRIVVGKTGCVDVCGNSARIVGTHMRRR